MRITIIQAHPDPGERHYGHALAEAYTSGARENGHEVDTIDVSRLDFPLLRSRREHESGDPPIDIRHAQEQLLVSNHICKDGKRGLI